MGARTLSTDAKGMAINNPDARRLVPLLALAGDLGVSPRALREAVDAGDVPAVRIGKRGLLFDRESVERVLLDRAAATWNETARA